MNESAPFLLRPFPEWENRVRAAFTSRHLAVRDPSLPNPAAGSPPSPAGASTGAYSDLNLGFLSGDDPERVARNWKTVLDAEGLAEKTLVIPRMVHGDVFIDADGLTETGNVREAEGPEVGEAGLRRLEPQGADALFSRSSRRVLAVTMADCLTALIFDPAGGTIAAVHAGWRGTRARILEKTLRFLADSGRIRAESALVAFGPCLRPDSLEVGAEVAAGLDPEFVIGKAGRFYFDMPGCNRAQAIAAGVLVDHIRDSGGCTLTEPERYFSYRRDGQASGRLAAFISLVEP